MHPVLWLLRCPAPTASSTLTTLSFPHLYPCGCSFTRNAFSSQLSASPYFLTHRDSLSSLPYRRPLGTSLAVAMFSLFNCPVFLLGIYCSERSTYFPSSILLNFLNDDSVLLIFFNLHINKNETGKHSRLGCHFSMDKALQS